MKLLEGKVALITGGARGIGKALALRFAAEGAMVAVSDLHYDEQMQATENELMALGVKAKGYASNAASFDESEKLIEEVVKDFGRVDVLINNAGITRDNLLLRMSEQDWDAVMAVNLKSVFNLTKAVQKTMIKQKSGSIINMSSVVGVNGNAGQANYSASKAGMIGFTKSIAKELGSRNIRCNAIAPGFIETEMTHKLSDEVRQQWISTIPLRRSGKPEDVADVAVFLASSLSAYITGQVISVCGGINM
ncbi:MAG: 3-oxoacyl-[acyl-carrier-protein] reductase [Bacteroidales bacterium]|nr:3-oxoacyl-[acyl-carrier-protein] reductase [Bacteroidales bacterium]